MESRKMIQVNLFPASVLRNSYWGQLAFYRKHTTVYRGCDAVINRSDSTWVLLHVQSFWKDLGCLPAPWAMSPALSYLSGFLRAALGEYTVFAFLCLHPVLNYKHNTTAFFLFFFSYGSRLPSGVTGQGWVMVEFYPQAPRDHSVRTQNLIKKVIKHHVTATWPGKPRGGFCHCTNFLVVSVYVWARVHKCLELRQIKYGATRE